MDCGLSLEQGTQLRDLRMFSTLPFLRLLALTIALGFARPLVWSQGAYDLQQQRQDRQAQEPPKQFVQTCTLCHGGDAKGTDRAPSLVNNADLRSMPDSAISDIIRMGKGGMPAFLLSPAEIETLTRYVRSLNATNLETTAAGNAQAGESIFLGSGQCSTCHIARGSGISRGPDLSSVAKRLTIAEMTQSLVDPGAHIATGYSMASVTLKNGSTLRGFIRAQGSHDLVLQASDGKLHLLLKSEYRDLIPDKLSAMPAFQGTKDQQRDLIAFLSRLNGIETGPLPESQTAVTQEDIDRISHPREGDWPTYNGTLDGNRHSNLNQVNLKNVSKLHLQWTYSIPFFGLETTPVVVDGVMYVTGNNQVYALSGRTGREIWRYERPKSERATISSDAAIGVNRGVAVLGERVFYLTDDAHLLALDRLTGALLWDVYTPEETQRYGGTSAPLVVGNLVITGVSGADDGIRGFIAAYKATTGELAWRLWTVPKPGEPGSETWNGSALALGGGATWLSGSADTESDVLYWAVGNPHPDTDGDERLGSNLYTNSDLALM